MNPSIKSTSHNCSLALGFAVTALAWQWNSIGADNMQSMKGAEHLMMLNQIKTKAQAEALQPGDKIAMACSKSKSVMVENGHHGKGPYQNDDRA
jgi:hypothetical protein